jgi:hypothetical protein
MPTDEIIDNRKQKPVECIFPAKGAERRQTFQLENGRLTSGSIASTCLRRGFGRQAA